MSASTGSSTHPDWLQGIRFTLGSYQQFVLSGNVHDVFRAATRAPSGEMRPIERTLQDLLADLLCEEGFSVVVGFDTVDGFTRIACRGDEGERALEALPIRIPGGTPQDFVPVARAVTRGRIETAKDETTPQRLALIVNYAGRLAGDPRHLDAAEADRFAHCVKLADNAQLFKRASGPGHTFNPIFWIADHDSELPGWLAAGSPRIRVIPIPLPTMAQRLATAHAYVDPARPSQTEPTGQARALADAADGLPLRAIAGIRQVALRAGLALEEPACIQEASRIYRLGVHDNPWREDLVRTKLAGAHEAIGAYVKGQERAVRRTVAGLARAALGLSGAHTASSTRRPRGVFMFAGPTGVGKTELVKSVARILFGSEDACIRFDMSEFSAEHSDQRLLGAPPGYVGHDAGGELTNAVRARPFCVLLFDEIEKAHRLILDKFLQILEDGRLTDGRGRTTHFSETLIFFTTNLGIYDEAVERVPAGSSDASLPSFPGSIAGRTRRVRVVEPETPAEDMEALVRQGITRHFVERIGRPEILNRIGENIVVFRFIEPQAAQAILRDMVGRVCATVRREHGIALDLSSQAFAELFAACVERLADFGGRGIGNVVDEHLTAPLALHLLGRPQGARGELRIESLADFTAQVRRGECG